MNIPDEHDTTPLMSWQQAMIVKMMLLSGICEMLLKFWLKNKEKIFE